VRRRDIAERVVDNVCNGFFDGQHHLQLDVVRDARGGASGLDPIEQTWDFGKVRLDSKLIESHAASYRGVATKPIHIDARMSWIARHGVLPT
jgi:hypothetical protein